ncbi:MAG: glycoside hydrolase family 3 C-terminal domain-containing protein [Psychromonas sp.]
MKSIGHEIETLVQKLTLEEKASLCSGLDEWSLKAIDRLDIPSLWMADGPHGLRKAPSSDVGGFGGTQHPSTCYPTASALAATWDCNLVHEVAKHIAIECQALDVDIILGPGVNIKRSPLGGRNFEYFTEDPILAGELATAYINGAQEQGIGTSLKHFACNTQETQRMMVSSEIDERTLREIYLPNFEIPVKKAQPWTVMAAYNPLNGVDCTANSYLLNDILVKEWGYQGIVVSDWASVYDRVEGIKAGMHIEMPGSAGINDETIVAAVKSGKLDEKQLDKLVKEILTIVFKAKSMKKEGVIFSAEKHHAYARKVAAESAVLLKNNNETLPILVGKYRKIALLGEFSITPRYQGNGSSEVKPTMLDTVKDEVQKLAGNEFEIEFAQGYQLNDDNNTSLIPEAVAIAKEADIAVIHVGLPSHYESEGYDRKHIDIPPAQVALIEEVAKVQKNIVVLLTNGSAISMQWLDQVPAVLETWLGGQAAGGAIADLLFGRVNPSGKLAETFPIKVEDTPAYLDFPGLNRKLNYSEGIFVGYRWYDKRKIETLFPFGHGLSYTRFEYSNLTVSKSQISSDESLTVSCTVKNIGIVSGKEIVQLYVCDKKSRLIRPIKELKGFSKVNLSAGEKTNVEFELTTRDFSYFDESFSDWVAESGQFEILVAASSEDIRLRSTIQLNSKQPLKIEFDERTSLREWIQYPETKAIIFPVVEEFFMKMPHEFEGELIDFKIKNDYFMDMPMIKYHYFSRGAIASEAIAAALEQSKVLVLTH